VVANHDIGSLPRPAAQLRGAGGDGGGGLGREVQAADADAPRGAGKLRGRARVDHQPVEHGAQCVVARRRSRVEDQGGVMPATGLDAVGGDQRRRAVVICGRRAGAEQQPAALDRNAQRIRAVALGIDHLPAGRVGVGAHEPDLNGAPGARRRLRAGKRREQAGTLQVQRQLPDRQHRAQRVEEHRAADAHRRGLAAERQAAAPKVVGAGRQVGRQQQVAQLGQRPVAPQAVGAGRIGGVAPVCDLLGSAGAAPQPQLLDRAAENGAIRLAPADQQRRAVLDRREIVRVEFLGDPIDQQPDRGLRRAGRDAEGDMCGRAKRHVLLGG